MNALPEVDVTERGLVAVRAGEQGARARRALCAIYTVLVDSGSDVLALGQTWSEAFIRSSEDIGRSRYFAL